MKKGATTKYLKHPMSQNYFYCSHWWEVSSTWQRACREQNVPYFSYRDVVWPELENPPPELPLYWNGLSHPEWSGHHLVAEGLAHMLARANWELCVPDRT